MFTISYGPKGQNERKLLEEKAALCHLLCLFCILTARKGESRTNGQEDIRRPAEQSRTDERWDSVVPRKRKGYATEGLKIRTRKQERAAPPKVSVYPGTGTVLAEVVILEQL